MKSKMRIKRKNKKLIRRKIKTKENLRFLRRKLIYIFIFFRPEIAKTEQEIVDSESSQNLNKKLNMQNKSSESIE